MTYPPEMVVTKLQVMFINQDPKMYGVFKPLVIDLEAYELAA